METVWPRKGDSLFKTGGYQNLAACAITDLSLTATGYKDAGDILVESLNERGRNDALVFPILFCYRQYIELQLKVLTEAGAPVFAEDFKHTRDLSVLWSPLKERILRKPAEQESIAVVEVVEKCILEMNAVDPEALAFRYPEFPAMQTINNQVDLGNLKSVINKLSEFLGALESEWDAAV